MNTVGENIDTFALFVGSLSAATTQEGLVQYFSKFGAIQGANLITDWATGASKRCAIVFCADEATCCRALAYKTHRLDGKMIRVTMADQEKKGTKKISTTNLFVGNIAEKCTEDDIKVLFNKFGQIESVRFFKNASTKPNTKNAIIQYFDSRSVELAFKSKCEMGTTDDCLKISPLKHKKLTNLKSDNFEDIASMMMQMCVQGFSGAHSQMLDPEDQADSQDFDFPNPPVRKHRKSSSVDMLPASKSSHPELAGFNQQFVSTNPAMNLFAKGPISMLRPPKRNDAAWQPIDGYKAAQLKLTPAPLPTIVSTPPTQDQQENYNFVTLVDLFDEDDGLSTSFYGESPIRKSRAGKSNAGSQLRFQDSRSDSFGERESISSRG